MRVIAVIPARFASTRLAGKPLAEICGKTMIRRVWERAALARLVSEAVVATDDERIYGAVAAFGGRAVMTSASHCSGADRIAEAVSGMDADIIVNVQGDEPMIDPRAIDAAVEPLIAEPEIQLSTLKTRISAEDEYRNPNCVKVVTDKDGWALYFSRSPIPYAKAFAPGVKAGVFKHIGLYVYRRAFLDAFSRLPPSALEEAEGLEQLRALENGFRIKVVETSYNPVSVDTPEDLERVRRIIGAGEKV
ncbi:MAG: 3-deoxy-manno-octulosonate cytidylyltransferase [Deltaproteobacteria bacterium]|nr:3-deoxy-manno-octulosonate cytidylyltransferase [Deltaproteobacteria bacterium]